MTYMLGVAAAVIAGIAFNIGILIQKTAINRITGNEPLMRSLLGNRVWIAGFGLQFFVGVPLNALSVGLIGPALVPGLMSMGLVFLAIGAVRIQKERISIRELSGIAAVILGVIAFGLTGLSINVNEYSIRDPGLALRSGLFLCILLLAAAGCLIAAAGIKSPEKKGTVYALGVGLLMNLTNFGLGFVTAGLVRFTRRNFDPIEITVFSISLALVIAASASAVFIMQYALRYGRAVIVVPLLNATAQVLPVGVFFFVYRPYAPGAVSLVFLVTAGAFILSGMLLLAGRLAGESGGTART